MDKNKEKDTTIWKPKGSREITRPGGPDRRRRKSGRSARKTDSAAGYDTPKSGIGKLSLLIGAGAILIALVRGAGNGGCKNKD